MKIRILLGILCVGFLTCRAMAQDSVCFRYGLQFRYQPTDFFTGISAAREKHCSQHEIQLNTGVNSTFFQRRFYPQISYRFSWLPVNKRWIQLGPLATANVSTRRFNKASAHGFSYEEQFLGGFSIGSGNRSSVRLSLAVGIALEQNWSALLSKHVTYTSWIFLGEFSYSYAF